MACGNVRKRCLVEREPSTPDVRVRRSQEHNLRHHALRYRPETGELRSLPPPPGPGWGPTSALKRRRMHSATLVGADAIWCVGGGSLDQIHGDVCVLHTKTHEWETVDIEGAPAQHPIVSASVGEYGLR